MGGYRFMHRANVFAEYNVYTNYGNRNHGSIGLQYRPAFRYWSRGRLSGDFVLSRRNKDLIDDTGTLQTRTLKRWEHAAALSHRLDLGRFELGQSVDYERLNYDEQSGSTSYDYDGWTAKLSAQYQPADWLKLLTEFSSGHRDYQARKTYSIRSGPYAGKPFQIRNFREHVVEGRAYINFWGRNEVSLFAEYALRKDNFENFYGYIQRQYSATFKLYLCEYHETKIMFEFKNKDYPNYWNNSIGRAKRVHIYYTDFQFEHRYALTNKIVLLGSFRNYNKVSNYRLYDYHDVTGGMGIEVTI
ncbi:MAG: hypothetical protein SGI97_04410 [candidate division Zixibacteria bacterium]|nr:hypothetical protein [candidate division Zixibacteria bacterium]